MFALNGVLFGTVFGRLPAIRANLGLSEGEIAVALGCSMAGLLVSQLLAGAATVRLGSRPLVVAGGVLGSLALVPVGLAGTLPALAAAFALFGTASGVLDVSMNLQGLHVERRLGRPLFSSLHAAFSFGALAGAGLAAVAAAAALPVATHLPIVAVAGATAILVCGRRLLGGDRGEPRAPAFARPSVRLAAVGALAFCALLAEGSLNDWTTLFLVDAAGTSAAVAALGLTAFSLAMGTGRLAGDRVTARLGARATARAGATLAAAGVAVALLTAAPAPAIAGLLAAGLGLATLFPLALKAAGGAADVAAVSTLGYLAFLAGPALIGGGAELVGLRLSLVVVVAAAAGAALLARSLPR